MSGHITPEENEYHPETRLERQAEQASDTIRRLTAEWDEAEARSVAAEKYVDGNDVMSDYRTATHMRRALEAAEKRVAVLEAEVNKGRALLDTFGYLRLDNIPEDRLMYQAARAATDASAAGGTK